MIYLHTIIAVYKWHKESWLLIFKSAGFDDMDIRDELSQDALYLSLLIQSKTRSNYFGYRLIENS